MIMFIITAMMIPSMQQRQQQIAFNVITLVARICISIDTTCYDDHDYSVYCYHYCYYCDNYDYWDYACILIANISALNICLVIEIIIANIAILLLFIVLSCICIEIYI